MTVPPGAVPGLLDHARRSGWQLALQVWQDSGVSWEAAAESGHARGDTWTAAYAPAPDRPPPLPFGAAGETGPWPIQPPATPAPPARDPAPAGHAERVPNPQPAPNPASAPRPAPPAGAGPEPDHWNNHPLGGFTSRSWPDDDSAWVTPPPAAYAQPRYAQPAYAAPSGRGAGEYAEYSPAPPLSAPIGLAPPEAPPQTRPEARSAASQDLFRAWQGSVREAAAPRRSWPAPRPAGPSGTGRPVGTPRRRRQARQAAKIGVPAVVIVTVGAGALLMLTGRANEMLAERATNGALPAGAQSAPGQSAAGVPGTAAGVVLPGYPGQQGAVTVGSLASAGGSSVAVGSADGHPATWRRAHDATWPLVSASVLGAVTGQLTGLAHGPAGWVAVGTGGAAGTGEPLAVTSFGAVNWQSMPQLTALAGVQAQFLGVAAGPGGYVVVGRVVTGNRSHPAAWWSANLRTWQPVHGGGLDANPTAANPTAASRTAASVNAVVAVPGGFIAVGSHGASQAIWTSADGQHWATHDIAAPAGTRSATLNLLATAGPRVVAAGHAAGHSGDIPVVASSADGGKHWTQSVLAAPHALGTVTALIATGSGFVAAGLAGPVGAQQPVAWTSPTGLTWPAATPLPQSAGPVTALANAPAGTGLTGTIKHGASATVQTVPLP